MARGRVHGLAGTALFTNTIAIAVAACATVAAGRLGAAWAAVPSCWERRVVGAANASLAVLCVGLFPTRVRYASGAIGQALGAGLIGGSTPLVATALIAVSGLVLEPAYHLVVFVVLARGDAKRAKTLLSDDRRN